MVNLAPVRRDLGGTRRTAHSAELDWTASPIPVNMQIGGSRVPRRSLAATVRDASLAVTRAD